MRRVWRAHACIARARSLFEGTTRAREEQLTNKQTPQSSANGSETKHAVRKVRGRCSEITRGQTYLSDQRVDARIFPELCDPRSHDDKLPSIRNGHSRTVDALVAEPRRFEVISIQKHDGLHGIEHKQAPTLRHLTSELMCAGGYAQAAVAMLAQSRSHVKGVEHRFLKLWS